MDRLKFQISPDEQDFIAEHLKIFALDSLSEISIPPETVILFVAKLIKSRAVSITTFSKGEIQTLNRKKTLDRKVFFFRSITHFVNHLTLHQHLSEVQYSYGSAEIRMRTWCAVLACI